MTLTIKCEEMSSFRTVVSTIVRWLYNQTNFVVNALIDYLYTTAANNYLGLKDTSKISLRFPSKIIQFLRPPVMELKGRVLIYSILGCPHCMRAKNSLQELGIPYTDVSLDKYPHARQDLQMRTGKRTVPQIFFNARHIGGNDELQELVHLCIL